jgi:hypothetical protein
MLTAALPVFVSVTLCVALALRAWLPKLSEVVLGVSCRTCAEPAPLSGIVVGEFGALLISVRLLETLVPDVGVKLTVNVEEFPGANVSGKARPVRPNPVPGPADWAMLRLAVPGFVSVTVCEFVWPTVTVPKLTLAGTIDIWGWVPTPLSEIDSGEFAAVLITDAIPVAFPATVGVNVTLKLAACPADNVTIGAEPLRVKPLPVTLTWEMLTVALPVFVSVTL